MESRFGKCVRHVHTPTLRTSPRVLYCIVWSDKLVRNLRSGEIALTRNWGKFPLSSVVSQFLGVEDRETFQLNAGETNGCEADTTGDFSSVLSPIVQPSIEFAIADQGGTSMAGCSMRHRNPPPPYQRSLTYVAPLWLMISATLQWPPNGYQHRHSTKDNFFLQFKGRFLGLTLFCAFCQRGERFQDWEWALISLFLAQPLDPAAQIQSARSYDWLWGCSNSSLGQDGPTWTKLDWMLRLPRQRELILIQIIKFFLVNSRCLFLSWTAREFSPAE